MTDPQGSRFHILRYLMTVFSNWIVTRHKLNNPTSEEDRQVKKPNKNLQPREFILRPLTNYYQPKLGLARVMFDGIFHIPTNHDIVFVTKFLSLHRVYQKPGSQFINLNSSNHRNDRSCSHTTMEKLYYNTICFY